MPGTLLRATALTLIVGPTLIWISSGLPNQLWWRPGLLLAIGVSVLPGALWILKRQGRRAIPAAAIFAVVMFAMLVYVEFLIAWYRGQIEM